MAERDVATHRGRALAPVLSWSILPRFRELRGERRLQELAVVSGIHRGTLSQIERGERMPKPSQLEGLEAAYGPAVSWYALVPAGAFGLAVPVAASGETSIAAVGASATPASKPVKGTGLCAA